MAKKIQEPDKELSWRAAEFQYAEKDILWYLFVVVVGGAILLAALLQRNFFFAVFVVLAVSVVFSFNKRRPQVLDFKINEKGFAIGDRISYDYERLESFAVREREGRLPELVFKKKTALNPYVKMPVDSENLIRARAVILKKLPEADYEESLVDVISEWLGF